MSTVKAAEGKSSMCGKATRGTAQEASMFHQGRSTENRKEIKESREGKGSACSATTKSATRKIEKKSSICLMMKGTRVLWEEHS